MGKEIKMPKFTKEKIKEISLKDLSYELQLLMGARRIIDFVDKWDSSHKAKFGNIVNYFKDSAYIHIRNVFNALTNQYIVDKSPIPKMKSVLYKKWKASIEKYVMHIGNLRHQKGESNIKDGKHLNTMIPEFASEIEKLWQNWIQNSTNIFSGRLTKVLDDVRNSAKNDIDNMEILLKRSGNS